MVRSVSEAHGFAALAAEQGGDIVEYRIDYFTDDADAITELVSESPLPCIVTCRPTNEGGHCELSDLDRLAALKAAAGASPPAAYIDIELATYQASEANRELIHKILDSRPDNSPRLILSSHDFQTRPGDLLRRVKDMVDIDCCDVLKIVWRARSLRDNLEAFEIIGQRYKPTIALCMDEAGQPSRVLAKKFNALLSFASLDSESGTAPGQVSVREMKDLYRWGRQTKKTQVYGVVGHPVAHSMSPAIHNAGFAAVDFNAVYLPMPIPPEYEHFKATISTWIDCEELRFGGASVTIPHKQNLLRFVEEQGGEIEDLAAKIGAANTLHVRDDGSLYACNTDYAAALDGVCDSIGITRDELKGKKVAVIGAGGAARAIVAGFAAYGAAVTCYNRTVAKAEELVEAFGGKAGSLDELAEAKADIFINCTPIGMHPNVDDSPIGADAAVVDGWSSDTVVFDTIYNPVETKLLRLAKSKGCVTVSGTEMFTRQAAGQFELWTGKDAPLGRFEEVLIGELGK